MKKIMLSAVIGFFLIGVFATEVNARSLKHPKKATTSHPKVNTAT